MMIIACLFNLILDPIFIFGFGMGIKGAALGTVICQLVICLWSGYYFTFGKSNLKLKLKNIKIESKIIKRNTSNSYNTVLYGTCIRIYTFNN